MEIYVLIAASGASTRMGENKLLLPLGDSTVIEKTLALFDDPRIRGMVLVCEDEEVIRLASAFSRVMAVVGGGAQRFDSVQSGLQVIPKGSYVLVHDGARPLLSRESFERSMQAAMEGKCFFLGVPLRDTIKEMEGEMVVSTPDRARYVLAQTPQGAPVDLLLSAYEQARADGFTGTDDCSYLEYIGEPVYLVEGDPGNIKITYPQDRRLLCE